MICVTCQKAGCEPAKGRTTSQTPGANPSYAGFCDACGNVFNLVSRPPVGVPLPIRPGADVIGAVMLVDGGLERTAERIELSARDALFIAAVRILGGQP